MPRNSWQFMRRPNDPLGHGPAASGKHGARPRGGEPWRRARVRAGIADTGQQERGGRPGEGRPTMLTVVREQLGQALFRRVAGPDGPATRARIHHTPGPRWFGPDRPIRTVHADASMFIGGLSA